MEVCFGKNETRHRSEGLTKMEDRTQTRKSDKKEAAERDRI